MMNLKKYLWGPFEEILTLDNMPYKGALKDEDLEVIKDGACLINNGRIEAVGSFTSLVKKYSDVPVVETTGAKVLLPGFIDSHTHICFAGSRANDYSKKLVGKSYLEIAKEGGGIFSTVEKTRLASEVHLAKLLEKRVMQHARDGVTTIEVKSGYGLDTKQELKILSIIKRLNQKRSPELISTCLAAHICPKEFKENKEYLNHCLHEILPMVQKQKLSKRVDIFIEEGAFGVDESLEYLQAAKKLGFDLTIHADQFSVGGTEVAVEVGAMSADHLEASTEREIKLLSQSDVVANVLPGASLGLGIDFAPARKILDAGCSLSIASDWNPGSAPMGDLLLQASLIGIYQKLTVAETLAGVTFRAAEALGLKDRGRIKVGLKADLIAFETADYRDIIYHQGRLKPCDVLINGQFI